jgi:hypothetical protein
VSLQSIVKQTIGIRTLLQQAAVPMSDQEQTTANMAIVVHSNRWMIPAGTLEKQLLSLSWPGGTMNTVVDWYKDKDEIMNPAEVAKKNKIDWSADALAHQTETEKDKLVCNDVEKEMCVVDETIETKEVKKDDGVATQSQEKNLTFTKKATVHFVSKGRGVTGFTQERAGVKVTSDSANVDPFLTIGIAAGTACLSCVSTMNEPASHWHEREPSASPMPMDGE